MGMEEQGKALLEGIRARTQQQAAPPQAPIVAGLPEDEADEAEPMGSKYAMDQRVTCKVGDMTISGAVAEVMEMCPDYRVMGDDGKEYMFTERVMAPEEDDGMGDTMGRSAHHSIASALGLKTGATIQDCATAIEGLKSERDGALTDAKDAATAALQAEEKAATALTEAKCAALAGVEFVDDKASALAASAFARNEGEAWADAVARFKGEYGFLLKQPAPPQNDAAGSDDGQQAAAPGVVSAPTVKAPPMAQAPGADAAPRTKTLKGGSWRDHAINLRN